jgi:hypothetical protein
MRENRLYGSEGGGPELNTGPPTPIELEGSFFSLSSLRFLARRRNRADLKKHWHRLRPVAELSLGDLQHGESVALVECDRLRSRIHDDTDAAKITGHRSRQDENCLE